jgi:CheY-like chemotaxis protein
MKQKTILIADDNQNDLDLALLALSDFRPEYNIEVVYDGVEVLQYLRLQARYKDRKPGNPKVIFLDLKMPRLDGIEVLRELKSDPSLKTIPVVIFSSSREDSDLEEAYQLAANAYVVKPVNFDQFEYTIKQLGMFWAVLNEIP